MGKIIQSHFDGHGLNESIVVEATDDVGPGGAHHRYEFWNDDLYVGFLQFQKGPWDEEGSTPGLTEAAVIASIIDRLEDFQKGPFPSDWNDAALSELRIALNATKARADERAKRGVLGQAKP